MVSEIQIKILIKILKSEGLRYSEAYPGEDIDDDLYNYHLQQLVKNGLVNKKEGRYELTSAGRAEVQMMDVKGEYQKQFRVSVLLYVITNDKKILMCKRTRWPLRGDVVTPSGKIRRGEKIIMAAKRKLKEEAGLEGEFKLVGVLRSARKYEDKWVEDTIYHICVAKNPVGTITKKSDYGEFFYTTFEKAAEYSRNNVGGSEAQREILKRVKAGNKEMFYLEEEMELEKY